MAENDENYVKRAIKFLNRLFTTLVRYAKVTKCEKVRREEYLFVMQNGQEESITGPCIQLHGLPRFRRLNRNLDNPEFYFLAYKNISQSQGSMTPGV